MKKIFFLLVFVFAFAYGLECKAQTGPVFNYTNPTKSELESFSLAGTKKSSEYRNLLVSAVQKKLSFAVTTANVAWIFSKLSLEEVTLQEGSYWNSGWNPTTQKMETFAGHAYHGMMWVFRYNGISFPLIKANCGNIVFCDSFEAVAQTIPAQPVVIDTVYKKTVVIEQIEFVSNNPNERIVTAGKTVTVGYGATNYPEQQYYYQPQQQCCGGGINFIYSGGGGYPQYNYGYNNHHYTDYGATNKPHYNPPHPQGGSGQGSMSGPRPTYGQGTMSTGRTVTVGFGGGSSGGGRGH